MLSSIGCRNLITSHTRFSATSRSSLDHILSNMDDEKYLAYGVLDDAITDHLPIFAIIKSHLKDVNISKDDSPNPKTYQFIDENKKERFLEILENKLSNVDLTEHPDKILNSLTNSTKDAIDECFPHKPRSKRRLKQLQTPWYTNEIFKEEKKTSKTISKV